MGQTRGGTYQPKVGAAATWSINPAGTLIWNGAPFTPVGLRVSGTAEEVAAAKAAGIADLAIDLPSSGAGWSEALEAANAAAMRYLIRIDSVAPGATGFAVEPMSYRVSGITSKRTIVVDLPGATGALVVSAVRRDGTITAFERVPTVNGKLVYDFGYGTPETEYIALVYPIMESLEQPDYWESFDRHRDDLLASLRRAPLGEGLRGIVNPIGRTLRLPGRDVDFVPTSPLFQLELKALLSERYRNVDAVMRGWAIRGGFNVLDNSDPRASRPMTSFEDFARLVPLWKGTRGVGSFYDPANNRLVLCDQRRSQAWSDIQLAIDRAGQRRYEQLIRSVRQVANVPIVQEWQGWTAPYEQAEPALDGVGMRASGSSLSEITTTAARAASSILRWRQPGWLVATSVEMDDSETSLMGAVFDDLASIGARGIYLSPLAPDQRAAVAAQAQSRTSSSFFADTPTSPVFYPENANEPAAAQRLPGGKWWLPSPASGNRIDLGDRFFAYRIATPRQTGTALWTTVPGRYKLLAADPKKLVFTSLDGSSVDPKEVKGGIEVTLTELPILVTGTDDVPIPEVALQELVAGFGAAQEHNKTVKRDIVEESVLFTRYAQNMSVAPGANFLAMREIYDRMCLQLGDLVWLEAETSRENNFSDIVQVSSASNGAVLTLEPRIYDDRGFFADYEFPVRSNEEVEIWIAARVPFESRGKVSVGIANQTLSLPDAPTSLYGQGFGWYRLGTTRFGANIGKVRLEVAEAIGDSFAFDAIVIAKTFRPRALRVPEPFERPAVKKD